MTAHAQSEAVLTGRVTDASTGDPIARVSVALRGEERRTGTTTDSTGRYRIAVSPGTYRVAWSEVSYAPTSRQVDLASGATERVDVALSPRAYDLNEIVVEGGRFGRSETTTTLQTVEARHSPLAPLSSFALEAFSGSGFVPPLDIAL